MAYKRWRSLTAAMGLTLLLASCTAPVSDSGRGPATLATSGPNDIYRPIGNSLCRIANLADTDVPTKHCKTVRSTGALANMEMVRRGKATLGLTQSDLARAAYIGTGPFAETGADPDIRTLISLHRELFTVVARAESDIFRFEDLRGKRVGTGKRGAGYLFTRNVVLDFYGWEKTDLDRAPDFAPIEQSERLCNNHVDAIIFEDPHPSGLAQETTSECHARLVSVSGPSIDRLVAAHAYYSAAVIPGGIYDDNPEDVRTFGTQAVLITTRSVSDEFAYTMVKAVFENFSDFRRLHPALRSIEKKDLVPSEAIIPIHPGALKYYREAGLLP